MAERAGFEFTDSVGFGTYAASVPRKFPFGGDLSALIMSDFARDMREPATDYA
jgi:hypothetical protein